MKTALNRRGVKGQTIRRIGKQFIKADEERSEGYREILHLFSIHSMKIRGMGLGDDPGLKRETRGKWRKN
jgi:hypothetical protein